MVVDDVMGYAQAPCVIWVSTHTTAPAPSAVVGMPGNSGFPRSPRDSCSVSTGTPLMTVLIRALRIMAGAGARPAPPAERGGRGGEEGKNSLVAEVYKKKK